MDEETVQIQPNIITEAPAVPVPPAVIEEPKKKIKRKPRAKKTAKPHGVDSTRYTTILMEKTVLAELQKIKEILPNKPRSNGSAIQELIKIHMDQIQ